MYTFSNKYTTKQTLLNDTNPLPTFSACFSFYLIDKIDCSEKIFTFAGHAHQSGWITNTVSYNEKTHRAVHGPLKPAPIRVKGQYINQ